MDYKLIISDKYKWNEIPEDLCAKLCSVEDRGERWAHDSRYIYSIEGQKKEYKGFQFGTARVAVQRMILDNYEKNLKFDIVTKTLSNPSSLE